VTASKAYEWIQTNLTQGRSVYVVTHLRRTKYSAKHAAMFFLAKDGTLNVRSGKGSNCLAFPSNLLVGLEAR
jgi:hypothetical protein